MQCYVVEHSSFSQSIHISTSLVEPDKECTKATHKTSDRRQLNSIKHQQNSRHNADQRQPELIWQKTAKSKDVRRKQTNCSNIKSSQCIVIEPNERFLLGGTTDTYKCDVHKSSKASCPARLYVDRNTRRFVRRGDNQHNHLLDALRIGAEISTL